MHLTMFVVLALAAARLTRLVSRDTIADGPRNWLTLRLTSTPKLIELIECTWCAGFWISGAVVLAADGFTSLPLPVAWWWAIAYAVGILLNEVES